MARYCANESCVHATHPLPPTGGPCPRCGNTQFRHNPDVATVSCPNCGQSNEAGADACWACGASLNDHHRVLG
ncbi:MAG: hypothetical protein ABEJ92_10625 [Halobacteriales archaeon]